MRAAVAVALALSATGVLIACAGGGGPAGVIGFVLKGVRADADTNGGCNCSGSAFDNTSLLVAAGRAGPNQPRIPDQRSLRSTPTGVLPFIITYTL